MSDQSYTEEFCSLCRRSEKAAGKLIKIPGGLNICTDCLQRTMDAMSQYDNMNFQGMNPAMFSGMNPAMFGGMDPSVMAGFFSQTPNQGTAKDDDKSIDKNASNKETIDAIDFPITEEETNREDAAFSDGSDTIDTDKKEGDDQGENDPTENDPTENDPAKTDPVETGFPNHMNNPFGFPGMPQIQFMNFSDFQNMMNPSAQVKKKKKAKKEAQPILDIQDIPKPHKIKERLDQFIVGQEQAKKVISVAVYNHYKRIFSEQDVTDEEFETNPDIVTIEKSNILLLGPTGCGKTFLVRTLARLLNVPLAMADATSLTEAGYIGDDIESVVSKLLAAADNDVERAEQGIIFVDEIDKIAKKHNANSRDVSGESVQQGMLKLLEGSEVEVPVGASSKNAMVPMTTVNTRNILFICGGAFPDLDDIIKQRLSKQSSMGFNATLKDEFDKDKDILSKVNADDLKKFGMVPEFIGRLPVICPMQKLTKEMLIRILQEPRNAILKQYEKLLELDEVKLEFSEDALEAIAEKAMEKETGARALRSIIEEFMLDVMYEIPKDDNIGVVVITGDYIRGKGSPQIQMRSVTRDNFSE